MVIVQTIRFLITDVIGLSKNVVYVCVNERLKLRLKPILPLALPLHLARPLCSAHSHLGVRCHNSWRDTGVGRSLRAKQTLKTKAYMIFPRMPCKSMATVSKCKYFSINQGL